MSQLSKLCRCKAMNDRWGRTVLKYLTEAVNWVVYISISAVVLVTSIDVIGRYCLNMPLLGGLELLELSMAVFGGFAILYTTTRRGHISVDLFFVRFPKRLQIAILSFGSILGSAVWGVIAYRVFVLGKQSLKTKFSSAILNIPIGPFEIVLAFALALYSLVLLIQTFRPPATERPEIKEGELSI